MKKQLLAIGLSLIFILSLGFAFAQKPDKGVKGECAENCKGMCEKLLTEEQKGIFDEIKLARVEESKPFNDELREQKARHITLMTAEKPDLDEIYKSIDKMADLEAKLAKIKAKSKVEMTSHLTKEQRLKMASMRGKHKGGKHSHKGKNCCGKK